jgi:hypothetical protein
MSEQNVLVSAGSAPAGSAPALNKMHCESIAMGCCCSWLLWWIV